MSLYHPYKKGSSHPHHHGQSLLSNKNQSSKTKKADGPTQISGKISRIGYASAVHRIDKHILNDQELILSTIWWPP